MRVSNHTSINNVKVSEVISALGPIAEKTQEVPLPKITNQFKLNGLKEKNTTLSRGM